MIEEFRKDHFTQFADRRGQPAADHDPRCRPDPRQRHLGLRARRDAVPLTAAGSVAAAFLSAVLSIPRVKRLLSQDHFSVDGTLIQAWASMRSFKPKDDTPPDTPELPSGGRNDEIDFHGQRLSNDTHRSTTDPEARLYRKRRGREVKLSFMAHAPMENRNGLIVDGSMTEASGQAERTAALT